MIFDRDDAAWEARQEYAQDLAEERRERAARRRRATAWDEPPEYFDDEPASIKGTE